MLENYNLIYFAPEPWDSLWRNRQQLMLVFSRQNRVLFVEPRLHLPQMRTNLKQGHLNLSDLRYPSLRQISKNLFVFRYPVWAPISGRFPLSQFSRTVRRICFQSVVRRLQMFESIVWFSRPNMTDLINEIPPARLILYHVVDEYSTYSDHTSESRRCLQSQERKMLALADVVVVVSEELYNAKRAHNTNTYLIRNGVNYQAYSTALADPLLPDDLRAIKSPRLGYVGLVGDRLNLIMLREMAENNPGWSLVFVGQVNVSKQLEEWKRLRSLPNVHYFGSVDISNVPGYIKGLQVGLMPYVQDRHAQNIDPLKLYDYLAAGIPVASVDIPAVREFRPYIHIAEHPRQFGAAVEAALVDTSAEHRRIRRNVAAQHTWEVRAEQLSKIIQKHLTARPPSKNLSAFLRGKSRATFHLQDFSADQSYD